MLENKRPYSIYMEGLFCTMVQKSYKTKKFYDVFQNQKKIKKKFKNF